MSVVTHKSDSLISAHFDMKYFQITMLLHS